MKSTPGARLILTIPSKIYDLIRAALARTGIQENELVCQIIDKAAAMEPPRVEPDKIVPLFTGWITE